MAYKNRPLIDIANKIDIEMSYFTIDGIWHWYAKTIDVVVSTVGDITSNSSLILSFNFIVPTDFPPGDQIQSVSNLTIRIYHQEEFDISGYLVEIYTDKLESVFGKKLNPGETASITFVIPMMQFVCYE